MLINKLYRQQRLCTAILLIGMLLQMAIPLLDGTLVYRFSNWLTHESALNSTQIQQLRTESQTIEELAKAVANTTKSLATSDKEQKTSTVPVAEFFLQSFLAQADAQRNTKEAATTAKVPQKPVSLVVSNQAYLIASGQSPFYSLIEPFTKFGSTTSLNELRHLAISSISETIFPPASGQSTLAP